MVHELFIFNSGWFIQLWVTWEIRTKFFLTDNKICPEFHELKICGRIILRSWTIRMLCSSFVVNFFFSSLSICTFCSDLELRSSWDMPLNRHDTATNSWIKYVYEFRFMYIICGWFVTLSWYLLPTCSPQMLLNHHEFSSGDSVYSLVIRKDCIRVYHGRIWPGLCMRCSWYTVYHNHIKSLSPISWYGVYIIIKYEPFAHEMMIVVTALQLQGFLVEY